MLIRNNEQSDQNLHQFFLYFLKKKPSQEGKVIYSVSFLNKYTYSTSIFIK